MKPLEVVFTVNPSGGKYTAKLCYTCKTPGDIRCVKNALFEWLENCGQQMPANPEIEGSPDGAPMNKTGLFEVVNRALDETKASGSWRQYDYCEGLIKMARFTGAISQDEYLDLMDHLDSLKGWCSYEKTMRSMRSNGVSLADPVEAKNE